MKMFVNMCYYYGTRSAQIAMGLHAGHALESGFGDWLGVFEA